MDSIPITNAVLAQTVPFSHTDPPASSYFSLGTATNTIKFLSDMNVRITYKIIVSSVPVLQLDQASVLC